MKTTWSFHTAGAIHFGIGATEQLSEIVKELKTKRALLVTDKAIVKAGLADHVQSKLSSGGIQVKAFDGGEPEPSIQALLNCYQFAVNIHLRTTLETAFVPKSGHVRYVIVLV